MSLIFNTIPMTEAKVAKGATMAQHFMPPGATFQDFELHYPDIYDAWAVAVQVLLERKEGPTGEAITTVIKLLHMEAGDEYIVLRLHGICANLDLAEHYFGKDCCYLRLHFGLGEEGGYYKERSFSTVFGLDAFDEGNPELAISSKERKVLSGPVQEVPCLPVATSMQLGLQAEPTCFLTDKDVASRATPGLPFSDIMVGASAHTRTAVARYTTTSSDVDGQCLSLAAPMRTPMCPPATAALIMATIRQHLRQSGVPATMPSLLAALGNLVVPADALTTLISTSPASKGEVAAKRVVMSRGQRKKAQAQRKKERTAAALLAAGASDEPCLEPTDLAKGSTAQAGSCITYSYRHSDPGCSGIPDMPPTRVCGLSNPGFASAKREHGLTPALSDGTISTLKPHSTFPRSQSLTDITCKQATLPLTRSHSMANVITKAMGPLPRADTEPGQYCTKSLNGVVRAVTTLGFEAPSGGHVGDTNALKKEPVPRLSLGQRKAAKAQRKKEREAAAALLASSPPDDVVPALPCSAPINDGCIQAVSNQIEVNVNTNTKPVHGLSRRQRKRAKAQGNKRREATTKVVATAPEPAPVYAQAVYLGKGAFKKAAPAAKKLATSLKTLASIKSSAQPSAAAPSPPLSLTLPLQSTAAVVVKARAPKRTATAGHAGSPQPQAPHGSVSQCQATSLADLTPIFSEVALDKAYRQLMSLQTATPAMGRAVSKKAMAQSAATTPSTEQMRKASIAAARLKEEASLRDAFQAIRSPLYFELAHCNVSEAALCALPATDCV